MRSRLALQVLCKEALLLDQAEWKGRAALLSHPIYWYATLPFAGSVQCDPLHNIFLLHPPSLHLRYCLRHKKGGAIFELTCVLQEIVRRVHPSTIKCAIMPC